MDVAVVVVYGKHQPVSKGIWLHQSSILRRIQTCSQKSEIESTGAVGKLLAPQMVVCCYDIHNNQQMFQTTAKM